MKILSKFQRKYAVLNFILCEFCRLKDVGPPIIQKRIDDLKDCGLSSDRIISKRIIGGNEAAFGQYPWQAYIKIGTYQCGGVLGKNRTSELNLKYEFMDKLQTNN